MINPAMIPPTTTSAVATVAPTTGRRDGPLRPGPSAGAGSAAGGHDLYVAITRATHRLTVVHDADLPASLHRLAR